MNTDRPTLDEIIDAKPGFREKLNKVKRGSKPKKYVSPYHREAYNPTEVVCIECKLPSFKGLPPFIAVTRLIDGEVKEGILRHPTCPKNAKKLLKDIEQIRATNTALYKARLKLDFTRKGDRRWTRPRT